MDEGTDRAVVPDLAEPIVAYKNLRSTGVSLLSGTHSVLKPLYMATYLPMVDDPSTLDMYMKAQFPHWEKMEVVEATCSFGCAHAPGARCPSGIGDGCGIYAYKEPVEGTNAQILLWGKVYEYELGYRAEFAQLTHLYSWQTSKFDMFSAIPKLEMTEEFRVRQAEAQYELERMKERQYLEMLQNLKEQADKEREAYRRVQTTIYSSPLFSKQKRSLFDRLRRGV